MSSKCSICNNKKSTFISQGSGLFNSLGLNTPQNRMKMLYGMLLDNKIINMNNIINKFLLAGDKFMPEMHLRQPRFVYSACGPLTRHKELKNLNKQVIRVIFIEMILIKLVFNTILVMQIIKI